MTKEFKNLSLQRECIEGCLSDFGVENVSYKPANASGSEKHLRGKYQGQDVLVRIFENKNGSTTIGHATGYDKELFEILASELVSRCCYSADKNFNLSIPKFEKADFDGLESYLESVGAVKEHVNELTYGSQTRWKGGSGDTLSITRFHNNTVQFQGRHAELASYAWDYLINVLSLESAVTKQIDTFKVDTTVEIIRSELEGKIPAAHQYLDNVVRKQLSSALVLYKVDIPMEDYGAVAFPALRGLEGFIKQVFQKVGFKLTDKDSIGLYFDQAVTGRHALRQDYAAHAGQPYADVLADSYTLYANQRHGLFHMDVSVETSRVLGSAQDARRVVDEVFVNIEQACRKLPI